MATGIFVDNFKQWLLTGLTSCLAFCWSVTHDQKWFAVVESLRYAQSWSLEAVASLVTIEPVS